MADWRRYSQRWYAGYAFQGAVVLGVAPILLPLVVGKAGGSALAGAIVAIFYCGQLAAPLLGAFADRTSRFRLVYFAGYVLLGLGLALFPAMPDAWGWAGMALLMGMGSAATNTVASMYIVEFKPREEWDPRIGWLQTFYGTGQALGLALAALLQASPMVGLVISGALMVPGALLGTLQIPRAKHRARPEHVSFDHHRLRRPRLAFSQLKHYEKVRLEHLGHALVSIRGAGGPFARWILGWFLVMLAAWFEFNLLPLLMQACYGVGAAASSGVYAFGAGLGIFAYAPSGALGRKVGDFSVVFTGVLMTLVGAAGMAVVAWLHPPGQGWWAAGFFTLLPVAWSPLIVGGTALSAQLATIKEGAAMGIFNATTAIASVLSAAAAGLLAKLLGYGAVNLAATLCAVGAVVVLWPLRGEAGEHGQAQQA